ncbi:uncharacterized protein LOC143580314 [Bidens hawaiensis]|uniref:uncharacterized protein LOC143580314 n=1 Tax=Bidens hawaiensis TaxID=980011 RepID=UPI00404B32D9
MDSPAQVPAIERFKSVIPGWAQPFVSDINDVNLNGNCGFRAIAVGLGRHQRHWPGVRRGVMNEVDTNKGWCRAMFKREDDGLYDRVRSGLVYFDTVRPASWNHWFDVPDHGNLVAQTYGCVLVNLLDNDTESYFLLKIGPYLIPNPLVIGIANLGGDHWIYIKLEGEFPTSTSGRNWERNMEPAALEWKTCYEQRLNDYKQISQAWYRTALTVNLD